MEKKEKQMLLIKPCSTAELEQNAWDSFLGPVKTKFQNYNYYLRPQQFQTMY